jgi:hypothetical protein
VLGDDGLAALQQERRFGEPLGEIGLARLQDGDASLAFATQRF